MPPNLTGLRHVGREVLAGEGGASGDEVGGCALEDDPAAVVASAGAEVDDPVGVRHDRLVVLDDDDRFAGVDEPVEQAEQLLDVGEVEGGVGSSRTETPPFSAMWMASLSRCRSPPDSVVSGCPSPR